jgi:hypothetical protein
MSASFTSTSGASRKRRQDARVEELPIGADGVRPQGPLGEVALGEAADGVEHRLAPASLHCLLAAPAVHF